MNSIEGANLEDLKYLDQKKKLVLINYLKDKLESDKKAEKEKKKEKKREKKEKKKEKKDKKEK